MSQRSQRQRAPQLLTNPVPAVEDAYSIPYEDSGAPGRRSASEDLSSSLGSSPAQTYVAFQPVGATKWAPPRPMRSANAAARSPGSIPLSSSAPGSVSSYDYVEPPSGPAAAAAAATVDDDYDYFENPGRPSAGSTEATAGGDNEPRKCNLDRTKVEALLHASPIGTYILRFADADNFTKLSVKTNSKTILHHIIKIDPKQGGFVNVRLYPGLTRLSQLLTALSLPGQQPWAGTPLRTLHSVCK